MTPSIRNISKKGDWITPWKTARNAYIHDQLKCGPHLSDGLRFNWRQWRDRTDDLKVAIWLNLIVKAAL